MLRMREGHISEPLRSFYRVFLLVIIQYFCNSWFYFRYLVDRLIQDLAAGRCLSVPQGN